MSATVVAGVAVTTTHADTAPANPADPATPVTVSADALPTVQIDGVVWSQAIIGNTVYGGRPLHERSSGRCGAGCQPDRSQQLPSPTTSPPAR